MFDALDRIPVDRITSEARQVSFGRTLLTIVAAVLFGIGWVVAKSFGAVWFVLAWCATAVRLGWSQARGRPA